VTSATEGAPRGKQPRWRTLLLRGFVLAGTLLAGYLIYRALRRYDLNDLVASVKAIPAGDLLLAVVFAAGSYLTLTAFDWLGLRYIGHRLPYPRVALASFVSLSLGHSIGFAGLSSGPIRYRFYARWGLSAGEVAKLVLFCGVTVGLGLLVMGGAALLWQPASGQALTGIGRFAVRLVGGGCLLAVVLYLVLAATARKMLRIRKITFEMPPLPIAAAQVVVGAMDYAFVSASLHAVVSEASGAGYVQVASAFVTGNVLTLVSHVPGGLGVIEGTVMYLLPHGSELLGPLIVFRLVYFLLPLAIGLVLFATAEFVFRRRS
jgi:uncharacterized membrane protein YbhN (UPF0104 family)